MDSTLPPPQHPQARLRQTQRVSFGSQNDGSNIGLPNSHELTSSSSSSSGQATRLPDHAAPPLPPRSRPPLAAASETKRSVSEPSIASGLRTSTIAAAPSSQHVPQVVNYPPSSSSNSSSRSHSPDVSRPPSPAPSNMSGFLSRSSSYDSSRGGTEQRHKQFEAALDKLKEVELNEFIERTSKHMDEVHFYDSTKPAVEVPKLDRFRNVRTGQIEYLAFAEAWLCAMADTHLPRDLVSGERPSKLSISKTRGALERIYILCPPELLQRLLEGRLAALYRWEDPFRTGRYAVIYLALWWYDQLPAAVFAFLVYQILKPSIWPPDPEEVKRDMISRIERAKEAKEIGKDMEQQAKVSQLSHSVASSIGVAAMMGGIALNMAQERASPPISETDNDKQLGNKAKTRLGKRGMYRLTRELLDRFGPTVQLMLIDAADFCEKVKNLLLWRRPSATKQSLIIMGVYALVLSVLSGSLQLKLFLLWVWCQFFIVWAIQDRHPRYRRALNPIWYLLWNVPSDAESALKILKGRAAETKVHVDSHSTFSTDSVDSDTLSVKSARHSRSKSLLSLVDSLSGSDHNAPHGYTKHFALFKGLPGNLVFTPSHIRFETVKGFRRLSSKILRKKTSDVPDAGDDTAILFSMPYSNITAVKKESRLDIGIIDTEGLYITFSNDTHMRLASVSRRDEAFAFILARSGGKTG